MRSNGGGMRSNGGGMRLNGGGMRLNGAGTPQKHARTFMFLVAQIGGKEGREVWKYLTYFHTAI